MTDVPFYDVPQWNTKVAEYLATGHPRSSRSVLSEASLIFYHRCAILRCLLYTSDAADDLTRVDLGGEHVLEEMRGEGRRGDKRREYVGMKVRLVDPFKHA